MRNVTADNSEPDPYVVAFARRLQAQLDRPGWGITLSDAAAYSIALQLTSGEEVIGQKFTMPRDAWEAEYGQGKLRAVRRDLLGEVDEKGYVPAGPIDMVVRRYNWIKQIEVPEGASDDWDTVDVSLKLRVWKL